MSKLRLFLTSAPVQVTLCLACPILYFAYLYFAEREPHAVSEREAARFVADSHKDAE